MTVNKTYTVQEILNEGNLNQVADMLRLMKAGYCLSPIKIVVTGATAASAFDVTNQVTTKAFATVTGITLATNEPLPAIAVVKTLRVTASGTGASVGSYITSDAGATPLLPPGGASTAVGIVSLSDDGKTITFPNSVTAFVLEYMPRPAVLMDSVFTAPTAAY